MGNFEIYRIFDGSSSLKVERQTVHVSDDSGRIAMLEKRTVGSSGDDNGTDAVLTRYIYSNHLQSASLELDDDGEIISYEEYHPYGTTSYQAMNASINAVAKRYRYTGKERDEESGLYYHGARYYIPWLARWSAVDPMEREYTPWSPYCYIKCNPINDTDSTGMNGDKDPPKGYYKVGGAGDPFDEEGNNRYRQPGGWVNIKGTEKYKYYTNEEYLSEFGGNKNYRPDFSSTVFISGNTAGKDNGRILHADGTIEKTETIVNSLPSNSQVSQPTNTNVEPSKVQSPPVELFVKNKPLGERIVLEQVNKNTSIGQPGILEGSIPVWGSLRSSIDDFQNGRWGWGIFNGIMAVSDVFLLKSIATGIGKISLKFGSQLFTTGLTNPQLVQKSATLAERAIGGTGKFAGTDKHNYATELLVRYQRRYGYRGLDFKVYFNNGPGNRGFLDVLDNKNGIIYDWKFGYPNMTVMYSICCFQANRK